MPACRANRFYFYLCLVLRGRPLAFRTRALCGLRVIDIFYAKHANERRPLSQSGSELSHQIKDPGGADSVAAFVQSANSNANL